MPLAPEVTLGNHSNHSSLFHVDRLRRYLDSNPLLAVAKTLSVSLPWCLLVPSASGPSPSQTTSRPDNGSIWFDSPLPQRVSTAASLVSRLFVPGSSKRKEKKRKRRNGKRRCHANGYMAARRANNVIPVPCPSAHYPLAVSHQPAYPAKTPTHSGTHTHKHPTNHHHSHHNNHQPLTSSGPRQNSAPPRSVRSRWCSSCCGT